MSLALNKFHLNKSYSSFTQSVCMILKDQNLSGFKQTYQANFTTVGSALPICALDNLIWHFVADKKHLPWWQPCFSVVTLIGIWHLCNKSLSLRHNWLGTNYLIKTLHWITYGLLSVAHFCIVNTPQASLAIAARNRAHRADASQGTDYIAKNHIIFLLEFKVF